MKWLEGRVVTKVAIPITKVCSRHCPECVVRDQLTWYNKSIKRPHMAMEELTEVGRLIGPIQHLEITGGEPSLHPQFEEITARLGELFQCDDIMLVTNGWLFGRDPSKLPLLMKYQRVWVSHYTEAFANRHGGTPNTADAKAVRDYLIENQHPFIKYQNVSGHKIHTPPYGGAPCDHYYHGMIGYYDGRLYGCCAAGGLPEGQRGASILLTEGWRARVTELETPCEYCPYSKEAK